MVTAHLTTAFPISAHQVQSPFLWHHLSYVTLTPGNPSSLKLFISPCIFDEQLIIKERFNIN